MARVDEVIGYGTHAARPAAGSAGNLYYETDTDTLFRDNGSTWDALTLTGGGSSGDVTKLGEVVLTSGAASISFSAIAGTYRSLELHMQARGDTSAAFIALNVQFNGDTGANYDYGEQYGSAAASGGLSTFAASAIAAGSVVAGTAPADAASSVRIFIPNYAGTVFHKSCQGMSDDARNTSTGYFVEIFGGRWRSTAAITSIVLAPSAGNFVAGSVAMLYGIS